MRLLLILLLTTTASWGTPTQAEVDCQDITDILNEAVKAGYIKEQEANRIEDRCLTTN
jgi:hypothetical protein